MSKQKHMLWDGIFSLFILLSVFGLNLLLQTWFQTQTMIPMLFVLGVFLVSWQTQGYLWGIAVSLISVLAVNWAFTYPYWAFDLISPECISAAVVMLVVAIMTSTLTTRLKQQEKLKAEANAERMRGNLLRAVSHDLRTPLTSIYGACCTMSENFEELTPEAHQKLLEDVCSDSQWLCRMVENLLSVTRVDAEAVRLSKKGTVLEELVDHLLLKVRKHYPEQTIHVEIPDDFIIIPMDAMLIEQVLMNLIENAIIHAHGMQNLWLRVRIENKKAVFLVEDDGCGISQDRMRQLFTGLLGSDAPSDTGRSNMGIGLSVCRTIINAHGADITAANRPQGGAAFRFALELEEENNVE